MGLFESLEKWTAENVFLNTNAGPAQDIIFAPRGKWDEAFITRAVVIGDQLQGSNEVQGDGVVLNKPDGSTERETIRVELCIKLKIEAQDPINPDQIKVDGVIYAAKRVLGRDRGTQTVLFVRSKAIRQIRFHPKG